MFASATSTAPLRKRTVTVSKTVLPSAQRFLMRACRSGSTLARDLQSADARAEVFDLALGEPQRHRFLRRHDRMDADQRPIGKQRCQGDSAGVVRGQEKQRRLVRAMLVGRRGNQRQDGKGAALLDQLEAPFHIVEHGDLPAQQIREGLAVVTKLPAVLPADVVERRGHCGR